VGETCNRFADFGLSITRKCIWRSGHARTQWGSYSTPPDPLVVIRGAGGEGDGKGWKQGGEEGGREGREGVGRDGKGEGGMGRGYRVRGSGAEEGD